MNHLNQVTKETKMQEGKYRAKLVQYGFLSGDIDPATNQEKPPQFFAQFGFVDETGSNEKATWFGGFKPLQPGKQTSQREITLKTIKDLGYSGTQIAQLAAGVQSNLLNTEKEYEIELEYQKDAMGAVKTDQATGKPYFRIKWVNDPENTGFKNQMSAQDAAVKIGGLNLDADMAAMAQGNGQQQNTGYNMQGQGNGAQNAGQSQNFQDQYSQQQNQGGSAQAAFPSNQQQNFNGQGNGQQQMPPNNGQQQFNQQMGFDQQGNPPF